MKTKFLFIVFFVFSMIIQAQIQVQQDISDETALICGLSNYSPSSNNNSSLIGIDIYTPNEELTNTEEYKLLQAPTITEQPTNQTNVCPGSDVSFSVSGENIDTYQWQVDEGSGFGNITDGSVYSGSTTGTLNITDVTLTMNNNRYRCIVTNIDGSTTSDVAILATDNEAPFTPNLPDLTDECSVTVSPPTTTDNCAGTITGTTSDPTEYNEQGTYTITWTFDDGNGNSTIATQNVIINDITPPETPNLQEVTGECSAKASAPTTTDNCAGTITGTTSDPTEYTEQGTYNITWIFDDGNGNTVSVTQNVIVDDITPPETPNLVDLTDECSVTVSPPTTTDNCAGTITGTTSDPTEYSEQGTYNITWIFDDGNGNTVNAFQNVIIDDHTAPTITCLDNQTINLNDGETVYTVSGTELNPAEVYDNCNTTSIINDFNNSSTLEGAEIPVGTTTIKWTVTDSAGNETTCSFDVTVNSSTTGIADLAEIGINIYPNPSTGIFTIENAKAYKITISDIKGKIIYDKKIENSSEQIDISNQINGVYFIKLQNKGVVKTIKVIKK